MRTIIVKIESADDVGVTAKTIQDKWNFNLQDINKIKVTEMDICLREDCNTFSEGNNHNLKTNIKWKMK